jgi:hypothetical protein
MYIVTIQHGDEISLLAFCVSLRGADIRGVGDEVHCRPFGDPSGRVTGGEKGGGRDDVRCRIEVPCRGAGCPRSLLSPRRRRRQRRKIYKVT